MKRVGTLGDAWSTSPSGVEGAFQNAIAAQDPQAAQLIESQRFPGEDYITALARVANTLVLAESQRRLLQVQLQRAQQGLPPLDSGQYGMGVNLGLSPETLKMIGFGAVGLLAVFLLMRGRK